jgi:hypothetical protein
MRHRSIRDRPRETLDQLEVGAELAGPEEAIENPQPRRPSDPLGPRGVG